MIALTYPAMAESKARTLNDALRDRYTSVDVTMLEFGELHRANATTRQWDDILILLFDGNVFPDTVQNWISAYQKHHGDYAWVLPLAADASHPVPPQPLDAVKAGSCHGATAAENKVIVNRVGALLGLWLQGSEKRIFISYRTSDGGIVAQQLYDHLIGAGLRVWLDTKDDPSGSANIIPGDDVQTVLRESLESAALVLLLDTPRAPWSEWVQEEVNLSVQGFVPMLPLALRTAEDPARPAGTAPLGRSEDEASEKRCGRPSEQSRAVADRLGNGAISDRACPLSPGDAHPRPAGVHGSGLRLARVRCPTPHV